MLKAFCNVGYISKVMLLDRLLVSNTRVACYIRDGYIDKCSYFNKSSHSTEEIFRLTEKGQKLVVRELGVQRFYRSSSAVHDLALANEYLMFTSSERNTWKTESEM